jgi:hypothetical protein
METRHPEVGKHIREQGTLSDQIEGKLRAAIEEFDRTFAPTDRGPGSDAGTGPGGAPDEMRKDVGWDRISAEDGSDAGAPGTEPQTEGFQEPSQVEREEEFVEREGGAADTDVQLPG